MTPTIKNSKKSHEFIGLCLGILADNKLVIEEVEFLRNWLRRHPKVAGSYPAKGLFIRLCEMLEDEVIDDQEEKELFVHLYELTGSKKSKDSSLEKLATKVHKPEFSDPCPVITFKNKSFFLHGKFIIGTNEWLKTIISEKGGNYSETLSAETDFCIIGAMAELETSTDESFCSQLSIFSEKKLKIISEENWVNDLFN